MALRAAPASTPDGRSRRPLIYYGYWIIGAAMVAQFIAVGSQMSVSGAFLKPMTEDLGWTRSEFALAQTVGRFLMAFVGFFIGVYIDRYGGRVMMVVGVTILGFALFATSEITEFWQWLVLRGIVFTLGAALVGNLVVNVTLSKWFVEKRGRAIAMASVGVSLAGVVFPPLMTVFIDEWGWRAGWRVLALICWAGVYPAAMVMRRQPEDIGLHPDNRSTEEMASAVGAAVRADYDNSLTRREALRTSSLYLIVIAFGLGGVGIGATLLHTIPFLTDEGFSRSTAALMSSVMSIAALVSKPFWGWTIDFFRPKTLASLGFVGSGVGMVVVILAAQAGSIPMLVTGYLAIGFGFGGQIPLQETIWGSYFGRRHLGAVRSVAMPFSLVLGAGGPLAISAYFDIVHNYYGAFFAVGVCWALAAVLVLMVQQPSKRTGGAPAPVRAAPAPGAPPANAASRPLVGTSSNGASGNGATPENATPGAREEASGANGAPPAAPTTARPSRRPRRDYMGNGAAPRGPARDYTLPAEDRTGATGPERR
jgi:OFA family oxalate/formate antiporter-like MFS transporter